MSKDMKIEQLKVNAIVRTLMQQRDNAMREVVSLTAELEEARYLLSVAKSEDHKPDTLPAEESKEAA